MKFNIEDATIYLAKVGSFSYGTNISGSDVDYRGCAIPPNKLLWDPYFNFEQHEEQVAKGFPHDKVVYDIRKFFKLAAACNPNSIEPLFVEERFIEKMTPEGKWLREERNVFISQEFKSRIFGFATRELEELKRDISKFKERDGFGDCFFDLPDEETTKKFHKKQGKRALHVKRLMNMLYDFYVKETIVVFRPEAYDINKERTKDWLDDKSVQDLIEFFKDKEIDINYHAAKSQIPLKPDYDKVSQLCMNLCDSHDENNYYE